MVCTMVSPANSSIQSVVQHNRIKAIKIKLTAYGDCNETNQYLCSLVYYKDNYRKSTYHPHTVQYVSLTH